MDRAAWSQTPEDTAASRAASGTAIGKAAAAVMGAPVAQSEGAEHPATVRFAMAGHLFGRRRTVLAAVPIACVKPNPLQPRQHFDAESLQELADSIRSRGLLQPIIVRRDPDGDYTLIAGERRLRAAELAGVGLVPAILSDDDLLEVALEENVQREDLSPLEEAEALATLAQERGHSHAELAQVIHKSRPYVSNTLALTRLPEDVKREYFRDGRSVSREILISIARQENPEAMRSLWNRVKLQSVSVRSFRQGEGGGRAKRSAVDTAIQAARRLGRALGALPPADQLDASDRARLRRSLERAHRRLGAVLVELSMDDPARNASSLLPTAPLKVRKAAAGG